MKADGAAEIVGSLPARVSRYRGRRFLRVAGVIGAVLLSGVVGASSVRSADEEVRETPEALAISAGKQLFASKGCVECHDIWGGVAKERVVSDLGEEAAGWADVLRFSGTLWNHLPKMFADMEGRRIERATFSPEEMAKLITYLFFVKFIGEPGNAERGRVVFETKHCSTCHQLAGRGGSKAPRLDDLKDVVSAFLLARALWNHGPAMAAKFQELGMARPELTGVDIADVVASIRGEGRPHGELELQYTEAGTPRNGEAVFKRGGCPNCHAIAGKGGSSAPDLSRPNPQFNIDEVAAAFWDHGPEMWAAMREKGLQVPHFSDNEMSNLLVYLAYVRFVGTPGDPKKGAEVFRQKSCSHCHAVAGEGADMAPDLATSRIAASPVTWTAAMWNHAPAMQAKLREMDLEWPRFEGDEMRDVLEFVRSRTPANEETR